MPVLVGRCLMSALWHPLVTVEEGMNRSLLELVFALLCPVSGVVRCPKAPVAGLVRELVSESRYEIALASGRDCVELSSENDQ